MSGRSGNTTSDPAAASTSPFTAADAMSRLAGTALLVTAALTSTALAAWPGVASASVASCNVWTGAPAPNPGAAVNQLTSVTALSPCNVWAVGHYQDAQNGQTLSLAEHWNGTSWSASLPPSPNTSTNVLESVSASSLDHVWAVGHTGLASYIV